MVEVGTRWESVDKLVEVLAVKKRGRGYYLVLNDLNANTEFKIRLKDFQKTYKEAN